MKKLILLMLLSISNIYSQDSIKPIFNGIGIFKINTTTFTVINELKTILGTEGRIVKSKDTESELMMLMDKIENSNTKEKYGVIIMMSEDTLNLSNSPYRASSCKDVKKIIVGGYAVAGIKIKGLELTFLNDTLIKIHCDKTPELIEAIRLKYGEGELKSKSKEVNCVYKYNGNSVQYEEIRITESWSNDDISALCVTSKYYNDKCEQQYLSFINISSYKKTNEQIKCEEKTNQIRKQKTEFEKKKQLKDF
jgi:hypothetical protein